MSMEWPTDVFSWIGLTALVYGGVLLGCKLGAFGWAVLYPHVLGRPKDLRKLAGAKWAVVTGSTDGIGRAYAFELAAKGFDLVLISRTQSRLDTTAEEIRAERPDVKIKTIEFDFTNGRVEDYERQIFRVLDEVEVGVLVNNVGLANEYPERLDLQPNAIKRSADMAILNTLPNTLLCAYVLKRMATRKSGVVVNISTSGALYPLTWWAIYSATKKYVTFFTSILRKEYAGMGITIQTVHPMLVDTKMAAVIHDAAWLTAVKPRPFARAAIRTIGLADETCGHVYHELQAGAAFRFIPDCILEPSLIAVNRWVRASAIARIKKDESLPQSGKPGVHAQAEEAHENLLGSSK